MLQCGGSWKVVRPNGTSITHQLASLQHAHEPIHLSLPDEQNTFRPNVALSMTWGPNIRSEMTPYVSDVKQYAHVNVLRVAGS